MDAVIFMCQEARDMERNVDITITKLLVSLILSPIIIKQVPTNAPKDALSTVTNTDKTTIGNNQTYVL